MKTSTPPPSVTAVFGSPRPGSVSAAVAERLLARLEQRGANVRRHHLNAMRYRGCQACMRCKTTADRCVLQDDLTPLLDEIQRTDALLLASAVFFGDVTSQMKGFIDRTYSFLLPEFWKLEHKSRLAPRKRLVLVLIQGNADESLYTDVGPKYIQFLTGFGFVNAGFIRGCGIYSLEEIDRRPEITGAIESVAACLLTNAHEPG